MASNILDGIGTSLDTSTVSIGGNNLNIDALENSLKETGSNIISLASTSLASVSSATSGSNTANASAASAAGVALNKQYASSSGARLVSFSYSEGGDDDQRRAFFQIKGDATKLKSSLSGDSALTAILNTLESANGFTSFIMLGITENHQEKQAVMPTVDDYFVATFSGHEPQLLNINGALPFDTSTTTSSWFINYLNAYTYLFRASILAKYKLQLKLIMNDFSTYTCYPVSFTASLQSGQDNIVQFQMSAYVVQEEIYKAKGISAAAQTATTQADKVAANTASSIAKQTTGENNTPKDVGTASTDKNIFTTITNTINSAVSNTGINEIATQISNVNKVFSSAKTIADTASTLLGGNRLELKF